MTLRLNEKAAVVGGIGTRKGDPGELPPLRVVPGPIRSGVREPLGRLDASPSTGSGHQARRAEPEQGKGPEQHRQGGSTREGQRATVAGLGGRHAPDN